MTAPISEVPGSFRDNFGFVFRHQDGRIHRQINAAGADAYDRLMKSGLYEALAGKGALVAHEEVEVGGAAPGAHKVIRPEPIPFISYPYEWCFGQLKAAALLTLQVHREALERGMGLRDASAFNVQFVGHRAVFIDTLSFGPHQEGRPWVAYGQFCKHFLAPLALMAKVDVRLSELLRTHLEGVPLDLASQLLPASTKLRPSFALHLHLHARLQQKYAGDAGATQKRGATVKVTKNAALGLVDSLRGAIEGLRWRPEGTEWADYYAATNYVDAAFEDKKARVSAFLAAAIPSGGMVWDLGANTGVFSRLASTRGQYTVAFDIDPAAVERNYRDGVTQKDARLLPLVQDLTNPSGGTGWGHDERSSLVDRGPADAALALALIHHLAIGHNIPLERLARFFARLTRHLIIEFVPKTDSQVKRLLATREDIFPDYRQEGFEAAFSKHFRIHERAPVRDSERTLYRMERL